MSWIDLQTRISPVQMEQVVQVATEYLMGMSMRETRDRRVVGQKAQQTVDETIRRLNLPRPTPQQMQALVSRVTAKVGGLGFFDALLPPNSSAFTDILVNPDGAVWGRQKGNADFEPLPLRPGKDEVWRAVEALLAPSGRACTEASPTVDVKLPRDWEIGFGGARVKVIHPVVAAGDGFPAIALRLYEPRPVPPEQIVQWNVLPPAVMEGLLAAVAARLRVMVIGGTATGKTTLLSALCHGIPQDARIVTVEDPQEIWLPHPNILTLEARPAPPGSEVKPYTVTDGVADAMRLSPTHLIVGEVRKGNAALSLFEALMSDHAGLTTFHADGPAEAAFRIGVIMYAHAQVRFEAAKAMFAEAIDLVVQVGWREGARKGIGVWEVEGLRGGNVKFRQLWDGAAKTMQPPARSRL